MAGRNVELEGRQFRYFEADEDLAQADKLAWGFDELEDRVLRQNPRVRRVLARVLRSGPPLYQLLHWSDGTDLDVLDELLRAGIVDDEMFQGALLVEARTINCLTCGAQLRVLVADTAPFLFAASYAERARRHQFQRGCANCGDRIEMPIVELSLG